MISWVLVLQAIFIQKHFLLSFFVVSCLFDLLNIDLYQTLENIILCTFLLHSEFGKTCLHKTQYKITWNRMSALSTHAWDFYSFLGWQWSRLCPFSGPTPGEVEEYWKWRTMCILISQTNKNIKNILVTMELYLCQFCWHSVWLKDGLYFNLSKSQEYQKGQADHCLFSVSSFFVCIYHDWD